MERLPNDMVIYLALTMDLPEVISLCKLSQKFNRLVCNNNIFWQSKLRKDYNVSVNDPKKAKQRYKEINYYVKAMPTFDILLNNAASRGDVDLVRIALDRGADMYYSTRFSPMAIIYALEYKRIDVIKYLLSRGAVSNGNIINIITGFNQLISRYATHDWEKYYQIFYDYIAPEIYRKTTNPNVYQMLLNNLEIIREKYPNLYNLYITDVEK